MARALSPAHANSTRTPSRGVRALRHLKRIPPGLLWSAALLALLVSLYTLFGFVTAPRLVRHVATSFVREEYGRELRMGDVRVHPFKLYVEIRDVALPDADGSLALGFGRMFVDFEALSSMWQRAYVFREITLERPRVRAVVRRDGSLNLADLSVPSEGKAEAQGELPRAWVQEFEIARGELALIDRARPREFRETLAPISFALRNFRTTNEGGGFVLAATGEHGERLAFRGNVVLGPAPSSTGTLTLLDVPLPKVAEYLGGELPLAVTGGKLRLKMRYRVRAGKALVAHAQLPEVAITGLSLQARGDRTTAVTIPELIVSETRASLAERKLSVEKVAVRGLSTKARLEPDGSINLARLFGTAPRGNAEAPAGHGPEAPQGAAAWAVSLKAAELLGASIELEDGAIAPGTKLAVAPLDVRLSELSTDLTRSVPITLEATIDEETRLRVSGNVTPEPLTAELALALEGVRLASAQPYVAQHANLTVQDGALDVKGKLALAPAGADRPELAFTGDLAVTNLRTIDDALHQHFMNMRRLELRNVRYTMAPDALDIERVDVRGAYARVALSRQQVLNVSAVLDPTQREPSLAQPRTAHERQQPAPTRENAPPEQTAEADMPIDVKQVRVDDMRIDFADYFVQPNFAANLHGLHGTLRGLSSRPGSLATLSLEGKIGENARVVVRGKVRPFAYDQRTDLHLTTQNVELSVFNPYSGRFAGYSIARGELSSDIHYVLQKRELSAEHKIRIDQLKWGEKTDTKGEAPLPVKLATVLLRDRFGVIELDLPVSGSLDDPEFSVWPIVWQVLKNVIVKAVAAPFTLLAKAFEGTEDAQYISFEPGQAKLDGRAQRGLGALVKAMTERPELKLDVPVGAIAELDEKALADQKWQARVGLVMQSALRKRERGDARTFAELGDDAKTKVLESLYEELTGEAPQVPAAPRPPGDPSRREARAFAKKFKADYLARETRARIGVERGELDALGKSRGEAIERVLLASGTVDHTRVLLSHEGKVTSEKGKVRFELGFE